MGNYYESRRIYIKTVIFGLNIRNNIKNVFAIITLFGAIYTTELAVNKTDDSHYIACTNKSQENELIWDIDLDQTIDSETIKNSNVEPKKVNQVQKKDEKSTEVKKNVPNKIPTIVEKVRNMKKSTTVRDSGNVNAIVNGTNKIVLTGYATAYCANEGARMANGRSPIEGVHCAMERKYMNRIAKISDGKNVYIRKIGDTGGAVNRGEALVDIYMKTRSDCIKFGRRKVTVEIL